MPWGVDFGSRTVKIALLEEGKIQKLELFETIAFYRKCRLGEAGTLQIIDESLALYARDPNQAVVTTGYGRNMLNLENSFQIPETMAHLLGAQYLTGLTDFLLIDIGGQDTKVMLVEEGQLVDFCMNDKCAASSGRYLENMARVLGVDSDELGKHTCDPVTLNATCAIFGESELISKLVEGVPLPSLCAGVNYSIYRRLAPMLIQFPIKKIFLLSGGVAKNQALQQIIRENAGADQQVMVLPQAQFAGAIGCAYWYTQHVGKDRDPNRINCNL